MSTAVSKSHAADEEDITAITALLALRSEPVAAAPAASGDQAQEMRSEMQRGREAQRGSRMMEHQQRTTERDERREGGSRHGSQERAGQSSDDQQMRPSSYSPGSARRAAPHPHPHSHSEPERESMRSLPQALQLTHPHSALPTRHSSPLPNLRYALTHSPTPSPRSRYGGER
ncbi:hypothetical protein KIPB_010978 [Kipferlia bialata]|uniref:Uncharacterized protein n=1 Tax=Kipferlia bialata TaxID=797122 RepID=A0A391NQ95_9EUKA|nr:hypothetical protein KIPB_010978 [Kipferlia bialata]|eukprot:g10978.t1